MSAPERWPLPPATQKSEFLSQDEHRTLLDWVIESEDCFSPATIVTHDSKQRDQEVADFRIALTSRDLGPNAAWLKSRLRNVAPALATELRCVLPDQFSIELELAAHGDGAHYKTHLDIPVGADRAQADAHPGKDRILSAVYYFHSEPKRFSGGALRLYRFNIGPGHTSDDSNDFVEFEPLQNSLVAFPSFAPHEVRKVHCPSREFRDYRFALNCWFCCELGATKN